MEDRNISSEVERQQKPKRLPLNKSIPLVATMITASLGSLSGSTMEAKAADKHDKTLDNNSPRYSESSPAIEFTAPNAPEITNELPGYYDISLNSPEMFGPPIKVEGISVYGLSEPISNIDQLKQLYISFDKIFDQKLTPEQKLLTRDEQRDLLPSDKRYLELVVTESTYQSFLDRKGETGVDFVQWIKLHTELMTAEIQNGQPSVDLSIELSRIIVVDDSFKSNPTQYSKDIDASWFIDQDYRTDEITAKSWMFRYQVYKTGDNEVTFYYANKANPKTGPSYTLKVPGETYENIQDGVLIDTGLIHEWSHQILNLPDVYMYDVHDSPAAIKEFRFNTGNFATPVIDPYVSMLIKQNVENGVRGYYTDPEGTGGGYQDDFTYLNKTPDTISFQSERSDSMTIQKTVYSKFDYYFNSQPKETTVNIKNSTATESNPRLFGNEVILLGEPDSGFYVPEFQMSPQTIDGKEIYSTVFILQVKIDGETKSVYVPRAIFNMSKLAGVNEANYKIDFLSFGSIEKGTQKLTLMQESEMSEYLDTAFKNYKPPYAIMKIEGTSVYCVWTFE